MPLDYATIESSMSPRNWFGVGVRLIGLWQIVTAVDELVTYANTLLRLYTPSLTNPNGFLTHAIVRLVIGCLLLFSAASIVNAAYSTPGPEARDEL